MKKIVGAFLLVFLFTVSANAVITGYNCAADGDGAITMGAINLTNDGGEGDARIYTLSMDGVQSDAPAHVLGDFFTDTELDPKVWIIEDVDNQTGFVWTGYRFDIGMSKDFSITGVVAPLGWTYTITAPVSGTLLPNGSTGWLGTVMYSQGTGSSIAIGGSGEFGVKVEFLGGVAFCTEQTPIPEPATMGLLSLGALAFIRRRK